MGKLRLAFVTFWQVGHLVAMVEAAKRLIQLEGNHFSATFLLIRLPATSSGSAVDSYLRSAAASGLDISFQELPHVEPPADTEGPEDFLSRCIEAHKTHVKVAVASLSSSAPVAALVFDFFATTLIDVAVELGVPAYLYFTSGAVMLALMLHLPALGEKNPASFEDVEREVDIPGVIPIPSQSMPSPLMRNDNRTYAWFVYHGRRMFEAKGIIINTFAELERGPLTAIEEGQCAPDRPAPLVHPIGPILAVEEDTGKPGGEKHECVKWLDSQPPASVVFLCFGSMGSFDVPQVREIAAALERGDRRFLWCLRTTSAGKIRASVDATPKDVLPEGFLERTAGRGLVWAEWAPQAAILAHRAVGGFVTHCGWNSALESLWYGVPMLGWPRYAEQHLNAFQLVKVLGVAVELKVDRKSGNFVTAEEVERGVRCLMDGCEEGNRVRAKAKEMSLASRKATEKGGSSHGGLEKLAEEIKTSSAYGESGRHRS
ncbi:UDP-glucoronosyl and UDP-glucosyl transferase [Musa troglodytarum]|uniref:Glycosyltransferase n=1 Tax=Musa troglodytarum TaxID=320322 RepID=A0A9E7JYN6_9LILI|nr:UDP-glucoronosyl and UDP-glucosyl transferase [Musa troglodytarum]